MNNNVKITVITPTFNRANLIAKTIESILSQTYKNFEYYILDDGSTDNTREIVEPYLKDKRVKYLYHENAGEPATVNWGWSLAKGEYFTQINSDDTIYKDLFEKMLEALDNDINKVLAYPNFNFLKNDKIIYQVRNEKWNFARMLSGFGCPAAAVGTFIRRSSFKDWGYIRTNKYKHINDLEMYWNMALIGEFLYVPIIAGNWLIHDGQISKNRFEAIKEIDIWFNEYFSKDNLPKEILAIKNTVRKSILNYYISLIKEEDSIDLIEKISNIRNYKKELGFRFANLQVSNNDLIGNKFNGHDLHIYLRENNIDSTQIVINKESNDYNTYDISNRTIEYIQRLESAYNINSLSYFYTYDLIYNKLFLYADIIHLHLINNYMFNLNLLPLMSKLKPIVWTLHDPWLFSGHCIYHFDCDKWKDKCGDCQYLDVPFKMEKDNTAFNFEIKRDIIERSDISFIVASKWMYNKAKKSSICKNKKIYLIPFGINQNIFKPRDIVEAKKELGIDEDSFVIMARTCHIEYKGVSIIKKALNKINSLKKTVILATLQGKSLLDEFRDRYDIREFDWIKDDLLLTKLYQACDIFLMPSKQEAFGMMAIEAMSCGKTVLALEGTALPDVINSPECGIACKEEEYTEKLQYLIDNPNELIERGRKSLEFAKENYNKDVYVERIIEVYKEVMSNHKIDDRYKFILNQLDKYMNNNKFIYDNNISNAPAVYNGYKYLKIKILGINLTIKLDKLKRFLSN